MAHDGRKVRIVDRNRSMEWRARATNCPNGALGVTLGVGCAGYIIKTWIKGKDKAACGGPGCCWATLPQAAFL